MLILEKALTLDLAHFEDSEFYDKMTRAARHRSPVTGEPHLQASPRWSLPNYGGLLLHFSVWAVVVLVLAAVPAFVAETRFAGEAFRLFLARLKRGNRTI